MLTMLRIARDQRGVFTIFDLLLIIAVLSVIAAAVLPHQEIVLDEAKVLVFIEDLLLIEKALLKFYADMGAWPDNEKADPDAGIADVDLMGGGCGGSGSNENVTSNSPGILCQGNSSGNVFVMGSNGAFSSAGASLLVRKWKGPYINREVKTTQFGGSFILSYEDLGTTMAGANAFCRSSSTENTNCQDVVIKVSNVPLVKQIWVDRLLDDGNLTTGRLRGSGTDLKYAVAVF